MQAQDPRKTWRVGVLGDLYDPVGQLLEDIPTRATHLFVPIEDPAKDAEYVDEIIVLSQSYALAHLSGLLKCDLPFSIVLRRLDTEAHPRDWRRESEILKRCLADAEDASIQLAALTEVAASEFRMEFGFRVKALDALVPVADGLPLLAVDRQQREVTFALSEQNKPRESRRVETDALHWARLRRLSVLHGSDHTDLDLQDMVSWANSGRGLRMANDKPQKLRWLAVVPNGVGLGHITRMMALAKAVQAHHDAEVIFWCFSRAAEILQAAGFQIVLRQNAGHLKAHPPAWRDWETQEFSMALQHLRPDIVSYDGAVIDPFIFRALRMPGCGKSAFLWVRRGMLRYDSDPQFLENEQFCDLILEPGDLAVAVDKGPTKTRQARLRGFSETYVTKPVALAKMIAPYSRREAKRRMKLGWGKHCLVSLGGAFGDWDAIEAEIVAQAKAKGVTLIWAQSPLAPPPQSQETLIRRLFPLSRYLPGIDGVITATGYNSFHELMLGYSGPVMFAPTNFVRMDDQVARASYAAEQGWSSVVFSDQPDGMKDRIGDFMQQVKDGATFRNRPTDNLDGRAFADRLRNICQRYRRES